MGDPSKLAGPIASVLNTGADLFMQNKNIQFQRQQSKDDFARTQQQYEWERDDARKNWQMQNEYNSPEQQMQRLREAGLNPHLVYGKGADNTAASIASSGVNPVNRQAPQLQLGSFNSLASGAQDLFSNIMLARRVQNQNDLTESALNTQEAQRRLTEAKVLTELEQNRNYKFNNDLRLEVRDALVNEYKLKNQMTEAGIQQKRQNVTESKSRIETSNQMAAANIRNINSQILTRSKELEMKKEMNAGQLLRWTAQNLESEAKQALTAAQTETEPKKREVLMQQAQTLEAQKEKLLVEAEYIPFNSEFGAGKAIIEGILGERNKQADRQIQTDRTKEMQRNRQQQNMRRR